MWRGAIEMAPEPLRRESILVVLVDVSEGPLATVRSMPQEELRRNVAGLGRVVELMGLPVLLAKAPLPGKAGESIAEVREHFAGAETIAHSTNDAWESAEFVTAVQRHQRRQLVFAGIALDVGIALTALSALRAGHQVAVLTDVCGAVSERAEQTAWLRLAQAGAVLTNWTAFAGEVQMDYGKGRGPEVLGVVASHVMRDAGIGARNEQGAEQQ